MNELVKIEINTGNAQLDKDLKAIEKTISKEASARIEQAYYIGHIYENNLHKEAGYATISECFADTFGADISEKTIQALARIGRTVLTMNKGKVCSIIAHEVIDEATGKKKVIDYSYTVLNQILSIGADKLIEFDGNGRIWPEMTLKDAKSFMQSLKQIETNGEESEQGEELEQNEEEKEQSEYKKLYEKARKAIVNLVDNYILNKPDSEHLIHMIMDCTERGE